MNMLTKWYPICLGSQVILVSYKLPILISGKITIVTKPLSKHLITHVLQKENKAKLIKFSVSLMTMKQMLLLLESVCVVHSTRMLKALYIIYIAWPDGDLNCACHWAYAARGSTNHCAQFRNQ